MFVRGQESANSKIYNENGLKKTLLDAEAKHYAEISETGEDKRLGYVYDRRKETVVSQSEAGREIHDWRVGRLSGYVLSCEKGFVRFYKTSSSTLHGMKNKSSVIVRGTANVFQESERTASQTGEFTEDVSHDMSRKELKQFSKKASLVHTVTLDDDEKAALRWAPIKGSNAVEEAYGWMCEHFDLVAEDMPNRCRYNRLSLIEISMTYVLTLDVFAFYIINRVGEEKNTLHSLASNKKTITSCTRRRWKRESGHFPLYRSMRSTSYGVLDFLLSNSPNILPFRVSA